MANKDGILCKEHNASDAERTQAESTFGFGTHLITHSKILASGHSSLAGTGNTIKRYKEWIAVSLLHFHMLVFAQINCCGAASSIASAASVGLQELHGTVKISKNTMQ